jgi:hypothetical protein
MVEELTSCLTAWKPGVVGVSAARNAHGWLIGSNGG